MEDFCVVRALGHVGFYHGEECVEGGEEWKMERWGDGWSQERRVG
ncbi:hypothetical protein [Bartonella sp. AU16XJBT]|nr:hypothetical protein [Bartonella sp. AU16XJBT]